VHFDCPFLSSLNTPYFISIFTGPWQLLSLLQGPLCSDVYIGSIFDVFLGLDGGGGLAVPYGDRVVDDTLDTLDTLDALDTTLDTLEGLDILSTVVELYAGKVQRCTKVDGCVGGGDRCTLSLCW
jgi:hypothetical protein